jgi:hypothetical protein
MRWIHEAWSLKSSMYRDSSKWRFSFFAEMSCPIAMMVTVSVNSLPAVKCQCAAREQRSECACSSIAAVSYAAQCGDHTYNAS